MNNIIESALSLYVGIMRRDREEYKEHPIRMAKIAQEMGWLEPQIHLLICLHDALEVVEGLTPDYLQQVFSIIPEEGEILDLLTSMVNETSEDHFNRVLNSGNLLALQIKYCDCVDNAHMEFVDIEWYKDTLHLSYSEESDKYRLRSRQILEKIKEILFK